jgi:cobalamin biosynthesis protein CobT
VTDRYIANFLADKSADRNVWIKMGKLRIVSAVADIRRVTTGSANQPMVEAYQKKCIG